MSEKEAVLLLHRMEQSINRHDLDALVECFHPEYESVQPVHPHRNFTGRGRLTENWRWVFGRFVDFRAEVLDFAVRDCTVWVEWVWTGSHPDGDRVEVRGVMIFTVEDKYFRRGRLYLEPIRS